MILFKVRNAINLSSIPDRRISHTSFSFIARKWLLVDSLVKNRTQQIP